MGSFPCREHADRKTDGVGRRRRRRRLPSTPWALVLLTVVALSTVAGCSTHTPDAATPPSPTSTAPQAPDGLDVNACFDGTCEILVRGPEAIPLDPRLGLEDLRITDVTPDRLTFTVTLKQGRFASSRCLQVGQCQLGRVDLTDGPPHEGLARVQAVTGYVTRLPTLEVTPTQLSTQGATLRINLPIATDGTNVDACRHGQCSVRLDAPSVIPLDDALGVEGGLSVTPLDNAVLVRANFPGAFSVDIECGGDEPSTTCPSNISPGNLSSTLVLGGALYFSKFSVALSAFDHGGAVVTIKPPD